MKTTKVLKKGILLPLICVVSFSMLAFGCGCSIKTYPIAGNINGFETSTIKDDFNAWAINNENVVLKDINDAIDGSKPTFTQNQLFDNDLHLFKYDRIEGLFYGGFGGLDPKSNPFIKFRAQKDATQKLPPKPIWVDTTYTPYFNSGNNTLYDKNTTSGTSIANKKTYYYDDTATNFIEYDFSIGINNQLKTFQYYFQTNLPHTTTDSPVSSYFLSLSKAFFQAKK